MDRLTLLKNNRIFIKRAGKHNEKQVPAIYRVYKHENFRILFISIIGIMDATALQRLPQLYRPVYQKNWRTIKESLKQGRLRDMYHFPLLENNDREIISKAEHVISNYSGKIKVNVAFGYILKNRTTEELKFFHPSNNTMLFSTPRLLENVSDYRQFKADIEKEDAFEYARINRPSTNWTVARIICVRFDVYKLQLSNF